MASAAKVEGASKSGTRTALVLLALLVVIAALADLTVVPRIGRVEPRARMPVLVYRGNSINPADPVDLRYRVPDESLDEVIAGLANGAIYAHPMTGAAVFETNTEEILRSPRTGMLVAHLNQLPREAATARARAACRHFARRWRETMDIVFRSYEDPTAPKNKQSLTDLKLAWGAAMYALAQVGEMEDVLNEVRYCHELAGEARARLSRINAVVPENFDFFLDHLAILDAPARINIIATALARSTSVDPVRRAAAERVLAGVPLRRVAYERWAASNSERASDDPGDETLARTSRAVSGGPRGLVDIEIYFWLHSPYFKRHGEQIVRDLVDALTTEPPSGSAPTAKIP